MPPNNGTHIGFKAGRVWDPEFCAEADWVVVGTGAGGAVAALELARGGESVCMVEAGPWREPRDYPRSSYATMRDNMDGWGATIAMGRAMWPIVQASLVGGTTVVNSAIVVRTPGDIFDEWKRDHGFGGRALADDYWSAQDVIERELSVTATPQATMGRTNELAYKAGHALGMHDHDMHRNIDDCLGSGNCMQGCTNDRKRSANVTYIPEALAMGATLMSSAPVFQVRFERKRAAGVIGRFVHPRTRQKGRRFSVRARKGVIVAASATHSPALLMRSGVRHRAMGRYFRAHPGSGIFGIYDDPVDMNKGATQGWASTQFRTTKGLKLETLSIPLELVASRLSGAGHTLKRRLGAYRNLAMWVLAVRAEATGRVVRGPGGKPIVFYSATKSDMVRFREGAKLVAQMHFAAGAKAIVPGVYGIPYSLGPDELHKLDDIPPDPRVWTAIMSHIFGGCVMGTDPKRSVCTPDGAVRGYKQLYVMDASAIPSTLGVNPQHTIMAMARVQSRRILAG